MTQDQSLQDLIIDKAGELFRVQGYSATTIKQIAGAAGCTTAALYYYFQDGKEHILRAVIERSAQESAFSISLPQAETLHQFLIQLGGLLAQRLPGMADRLNWIMLQFSTLPDTEKRLLQNQAISFQHALRERLHKYVEDAITADRLAWLVFCSFFGYQQMFAKLEVGRAVDLSLTEYTHLLAQVVGQGAGAIPTAE
jgi:AcrR family transcriptional regulator